MNVGSIVKRIQKASADNAPTILTAVGVTGLITTAVLTGQASFKASKVLHNHGYEAGLSGEPLPSLRDQVPLVWKLYVPAVGTGAVTVVCIIAANRIHTRRAAALASAYTISQELFREYKEKVIEKLGEKKEQEILDDIAKDRLDQNPPPNIVLVGRGDGLCLDMYSGRFFMSDMENLRKAENDINWKILNNDYASLSDFWEMLGLPKTSVSDDIGWSSDMKFEVEYGTAMSGDGRACITVGLRTMPIRGFYAVYH